MADVVSIFPSPVGSVANNGSVRWSNSFDFGMPSYRIIKS